MSKPTISFFEDDVAFKFKNKQKIRLWLSDAAHLEQYAIKNLSYIFCSDNALLALNRTFLDHDTYTDVITFDNSEIKGEINGEIFISIERIEENALKFATNFLDELHRVMIHGVLHLSGYSDKSKAEKTQMVAKEDHYLALKSKFF